MTSQFDRLKVALADRYAMEEKIGTGGMATVYLAEDLKHHRKVAVKVMRPELAAALGTERFLREIEIAAGLRHPHILPLHDSGQAEGQLYYVMPYVEGESLRDRLRREKQLAIDEALTITREVAEALAYAHARGVVHRDIKPENIMLEAGHAVVADFGVAHVVHNMASDRLTATGLSPGTPQYMSPEQGGGEGRVDGRSDVYSLGCVLYEMLVGDPPFTGSTAQAIVARKMLEAVPRLRIVRDTVSEPLERVTLKALARTPADRFKTAVDFAQALATLPAEPAEVVPHTASGTLAMETRETVRSRRRAGIVGLALVAGVALLTAIGFLSTRVYDIKLQIPAQFTPSRTDFPIVGIQALVLPMVFSFVVIAGYVMVKFLTRFSMYGLGRLPAIGETLETLPRKTYSRWRGFWGTVEPVTIAEVFLITATVVAAIVLGVFRELLATMWTDDTSVLACASRPLHRAYVFSMAILILALSIAWYRVFRYLGTRPAGSGGLAVTRWAGLAGIIFLVLVLTLPWRLIYDNQAERALLNGERAYILMETDAYRVIYNAERQSTTYHPIDEEPPMDRPGTIGYVFEGAEAFTGQTSGC